MHVRARLHGHGIELVTEDVLVFRQNFRCEITHSGWQCFMMNCIVVVDTYMGKPRVNSLQRH